MEMIEPFALAARDGYPLAATLYRPGAPGRRAALVMPATGVPQSYYAKFAAYLAERGFTVLTFDYRGIGGSLRGDIRQLNAGMRDWALLDASAAFTFLQEMNFSITTVGHSFGGQAFGLLPEPERIAAAFMVGSQSGYWKHWPPLGRAWMWPATHVALPLVSRLRGYFPSARLGFGEDLPANVAIEWASWCRHPRYLVGALLELYPCARSEMRIVHPRELGEDRIGHFGFFRERFRDSLWREAADWLERQ